MFSVKVCLSAAAARRRTHALSGRAVCAALAMVALCAAAVPARATEAHRAMVVAENALAANAGVEILAAAAMRSTPPPRPRSPWA